MHRRDALKAMATAAIPIAAVTSSEAAVTSSEAADQSRKPVGVRSVSLEDRTPLVINGEIVGFYLEETDWYPVQGCDCQSPAHQQYHRQLHTRSGVVSITEAVLSNGVRVKGMFLVCETKGTHITDDMVSDTHGVYLIEAVSDCMMTDPDNGEWHKMRWVRGTFSIGFDDHRNRRITNVPK